MTTLDDVLNVGIPVLLILIILGFLYIKLIEPYVVPMFARLWNKAKESREEKKYSKDIIYE